MHLISLAGLVAIQLLPGKLYAQQSRAEPAFSVDLRREENIEENVGKPIFRDRYQIRIEEIEVPNGPAKNAVIFVNHTKFRLQVTGTLEHEYTTYTDARVVNGPNGPYTIPGSSSTQSKFNYPVNLQVGPASIGIDGVAVLYVNDMKAMLPIMPNIARLHVKILDDEKTIIDNYKLGDGSHTSLSKAFLVEKHKADSGDYASQFKIALIYKYGDFVYSDVTLYESYINMSSAGEYGPAQTEMAQILLDSAKTTIIRTRTGLALAQRSAEDGDSNAQLLLGCCYDYFSVEGVEKDLDKSVYWYEKSAALGNRTAMYNLGYLFNHEFPKNSTFNRDTRVGNFWYRKAAGLGHPLAKLCLGLDANKVENWPPTPVKIPVPSQPVAGSSGGLVTKADARNDTSTDQSVPGTPNREAEGVMYIRMAAERGSAGAQFSLGLCYAQGHVVTKDATEAVKWYGKAAEQDYEEAQYNLGMCYDQGFGVAKNPAEAVKWYRKAAEQGSENAREALKKLGR